MRLSFLISTNDRREALARCLKSIDEQTWEDRETLVVVDGSADGTLEMLATDYPHVRVIAKPVREGLGSALLDGFGQVTGDVIVNLDDDALLAERDAAVRLAAVLEARPDIGVVCMRVEAPDGTVRRREIPLRSKRMPLTDTRIGYFLGGAVAFRRTSLIAAGGYPADIAYGSWENDVAFRMWRAGEKTLFVPGIRVVHHAIPSRHNSDEREANYLRNEVRIAARYLPAPYAHVHAALWIAQSLAQAAKRGHWSRAIRAMREACGSWRGIRRDSSARLTPEQTRQLSKLSGRTWY